MSSEAVAVHFQEPVAALVQWRPTEFAGVSIVEVAGHVEFSPVLVPGPPGPAGPAGGSRTRNAGSAVSGHRIVAELADGTFVHADATTAGHANRIAGVSLNAAVSGDPVTAISEGRIEDAALSLTAGLPVFLGLDGALTQSPPAAPAFVLPIGAALAEHVLQVRIGRPIHRS